MKKLESYQSFDGTLFESRDECAAYENNALIKIAKTVKCICDLRGGCFDRGSRCPFFKFITEDDDSGLCMFKMNDRTPDQFDL